MVVSLATPSVQLVAVVGERAQFTLRALDQSGAEMTHGGSNVVVELVNSARIIATTVRDNADGSYHVQFDATAIGSYVPRVTVDGAVLAISMHVDVRSVRGEGDLDLHRAIVYGTSLNGVAQGAVNELHVLTLDAAGLPMELGGERFVAHFVPRVIASQSSVAPFEQVLHDNADGSYTARFQVSYYLMLIVGSNLFCLVVVGCRLCCDSCSCCERRRRIANTGIDSRCTINC